ACTELETHVLDWLVDMLALPDRFKSSGQGGGVIQDTASSASLCALLAARERATAFRTNDTGVDRVLTAYTSTQAHSSLEKAAGIAGIGRRHVRAIEVDAGYAMRPDALERALEEDRRAGHTPFSCAPPSAPRPRPRSTRFPPWRSCAAATACGCTWTRPTPAARRSARSCAGSTRASSTPTATASTLTSGCSPTSTATASTWPTARR